MLFFFYKYPLIHTHTTQTLQLYCGNIVAMLLFFYFFVTKMLPQYNCNDQETELFALSENANLVKTNKVIFIFLCMPASFKQDFMPRQNVKSLLNRELYLKLRKFRFLLDFYVILSI